ncbi:MAG: hypothetical protein HY331_05570 [Chloroflexi bacterium]|nr:hypothetical protein [Chloroflexota bacterium]
MFMQRITIEEAVKSIQTALDKYGVARVTELPADEQERLVEALRTLLRQASL